jgi:hypothetical protein
MEPLNIGIFSNHCDAINSPSKAGLYHALIEAPSSKYNPDGCFDEIWFYIGNSYLEFMIYYIPKEMEYLSSVRISVNNNLINLKSYMKMENHLVYVSVQKFVDLFIANPHPATDWLLFNQGVWNNA